MSFPAPFVSSIMDIEKEWIDYNGHMNMAYYNVLLDRCTDEAFELMGIGHNYAKERRLTTYTAEVHICYLRELHLDDRVQATLQILDHDDKRIRYFQELRHIDGWLAATSENLVLHVDMAGPKVAPFPADIGENVETMAKAHAVLPMPERAGRSIAIKRR